MSIARFCKIREYLITRKMIDPCWKTKNRLAGSNDTRYQAKGLAFANTLKLSCSGECVVFLLCILKCIWLVLIDTTSKSRGFLLEVGQGWPAFFGVKMRKRTFTILRYFLRGKIILDGQFSANFPWQPATFPDGIPKNVEPASNQFFGQ